MASSSVCNFLGVVTTKAEAESTSTTKREMDKASEAQRRRRESRAAEEKKKKRFCLAKRELLLLLLLLLQFGVMREFWWMERIRGLGEERGGKRDLEEEEGKEMDFLLYGDGGGEEEKKNVELRSEEAAILFGQTGQLLLRD